MTAATCGSGPLENDRLRPLPKGHFAPRPQLLQPLDHSEKMVAGERADLARKPRCAIGEQNLGLADPAGVEQDLSRRGVARRILVTDAEVEIAERDPAGLPAPAYMNDALAVGQHCLESLATARRRGALQPRDKGERSGRNAKVRHGAAPAAFEETSGCRSGTKWPKLR